VADSIGIDDSEPLLALLWRSSIVTLAGRKIQADPLHLRPVARADHDGQATPAWASV
jgi:hypothetical protein